MAESENVKSDSDDDIVVCGGLENEEKHFVKEIREKIEKDRKMLFKLKDKEDAKRALMN